jgi:uncharacterized RDD family membrane protein YckC
MLRRRSETFMTDYGTGTGAWTQPRPAAPAGMGLLPYAALAGVRRRRMMALFIDAVLIGLLTVMIGFALLILTLGLSLYLLPPLFPIVAFFYNGLTISGPRMGTPGMRAMDLEVRLTNGGRVPFINAAVHAVLYYVSWMFPPILLVSLLNSEKRCLHDIFSGIIITRRAD